MPSIWQTVLVCPSIRIPSWQRNMMEAPRPVPASMFSSQPFHSRPGWPQFISTCNTTTYSYRYNYNTSRKGIAQFYLILYQSNSVKSYYLTVCFLILVDGILIDNTMSKRRRSTILLVHVIKTLQFNRNSVFFVGRVCNLITINRQNWQSVVCAEPKSYWSCSYELCNIVVSVTKLSNYKSRKITN